MNLSFVGIRWTSYPSFAFRFIWDCMFMLRKLWTEWIYQYTGNVEENLFKYTSLFIHADAKINSIIFKCKYCQYALHDESHVLVWNFYASSDVQLLNYTSLPMSAYDMVNYAHMLISLRILAHIVLKCLMDRFIWHLWNKKNVPKCLPCVIYKFW